MKIAFSRSLFHGVISVLRLPQVAFVFAAVISLSAQAADKSVRAFDRDWRPIGRIELSPSDSSLTIANGFLSSEEELGDGEFSFRARAPLNDQPVQIWGAVRVRDRESRYVVGVRGGVDPQISFARYAPDGRSLFLGWVPLDPPKPGEWISVRVVAVGKRFHVYYNDEKLPRINVEDASAIWTVGGCALGGGWLPTEYAQPEIKPLNEETRKAFADVGDNIWEVPSVAKAEARKQQRLAYRPAEVKSLPAGRGEVSLDGDWLFMPDQDLSAGVDAADIAADRTSDELWHVMPVPAFWTPTIGWLHGEGDLPGLKGMAASRGPSDALIAEEYARLDRLTFDWRKTTSGWYRHHLDLPQKGLDGRRFELVFDAIAKISEIWVNGQRAGSNVGMFRQVRCDVTPFLKPGRNVIAVHDIGNPDRKVKDAKKVADIAVTVEVTFEMLNSLPHGMTDNNSGGIWQPVRLEITDPVRVTDVFVQPALDSAVIDVEVSNGGQLDEALGLNWSIRNVSDNSILVSCAQPAPLKVEAGRSVSLRIETPKVSPKLWTPGDPNLYSLELKLNSGGKTIDRLSTHFGFRTFEVADGKILLNGKPYWLRGGNHFPVTLRPNDEALARKFTELAKAGNVEVTRSHGVPFTKPWFDAADEIGMGVSFEGTWPWLMLNGPVPDPELIKVWRDEFLSLVKRHRNHPSLLYWTVNNEMKFSILEKLDDSVLKEKWTVLDRMVEDLRKTDPTRPVVADSAYTRKEAEARSGLIRRAEKYDDGDIDDAHRYYGWYNESPFHLFDGKFGRTLHTPGRPLISQEMSTGYPRNDDWPSRSYQFTRYVPQALVGNYAFEQNDPALFMKRQAFMTKEVGEAIRRTNRDDANGVLHFAYLTWFTDVWKPGSIRPKLTYYELGKALQPVLVSAELYGRHFYAGEKVQPRVCIANDAQDASNLPPGVLHWEIRSGGKVLADGEQPTPAVPYYTNAWLDLDLRLPEELPNPRVDAVLALSLRQGDRVISQNDYDILIANREWVRTDALAQLYDPQGKASSTTSGLSLKQVSSIADLDPTLPLVIGDLASWKKEDATGVALKLFAARGGKVLLLQPGVLLKEFFPEQIKSYRETIGEIVTMSVSESPIFDGLNPLDTAWFEMGKRQLPQACTGTYEIDRTQRGVTALALECKLHPDIPKGRFFDDAGAPLIEIELGKGKVVASEMMLAARQRDPIAGRLLANLLAYLR